MQDHYPGSDRAIEVTLDDGAIMRLRPLTRDDRSLLEEGIAQLSDRSRYLRFFSGFRNAPPSVLDGLSNVDGERHIAWVAFDTTDGKNAPAAAVHAVRTQDDRTEAEIALAVLDAYQHRGIARLLLATVISDAGTAGYTDLCAEILAENRPAGLLFRSLGGKSVGTTSGVTRLEFTVTEALEHLRAFDHPSALSQILG